MSLIWRSVIMASAAFAACDQPGVVHQPVQLPEKNVYYLISAENVPADYAPLKLKTGVQLVHLGGNTYQAGVHRVQLTPEMVTNDMRVRQEIAARLRAADEEKAKARVSTPEQREEERQRLEAEAAVRASRRAEAERAGSVFQLDATPVATPSTPAPAQIGN